MLLVALLVALVAAVLVWGLIAPDESVQEQTSSDEPEVQQEPQSASDTNEESPQAIEVPGLVGSALPEAEEAIGEAGLELGTIDEISSYAVPAGTVAAQEPAVGVEVDPDAPVNVMVSNGSPGAPSR